MTGSGCGEKMGKDKLKRCQSPKGSSIGKQGSK